MDAEMLKQYVGIAVALLVVVGPVAAAIMQLVKQIYAACSQGGQLPSDVQAIIPALISGAIVATFLISSGAPWWIAAMATVVALYAPKVVYDTAKAQHIKAAND